MDKKKTIYTKCPECSKAFRAPDVYEGRKAKCEGCKETFKIIRYKETCSHCNRDINNPKKEHKIEDNIICDICLKKMEDKKEQEFKKEQERVVNARIVENSPKCHLCGGLMESKTLGAIDEVVMGILAVIVFMVGLGITVLSGACGGFIIGIPICILALFMPSSSKKVLRCQNCRATVDRS